MNDAYGDKMVYSPLLWCAVIGAIGFGSVEMLRYFLISDGLADWLITVVAWLMFLAPVIIALEHCLSIVLETVFKIFDSIIDALDIT